jgi:hypothetical protein
MGHIFSASIPCPHSSPFAGIEPCLICYGIVVQFIQPPNIDAEKLDEKRELKQGVQRAFAGGMRWEDVRDIDKWFRAAD